MVGVMPKARTGRSSLVAAAAITLLVTPFASVGQTNGAGVEAPAGDQAYRVTYRAKFALDDLSFHQLIGYDLITLRNASFLSTVARPMLPLKQVRLALPPGMLVTGISLVALEQHEILGEYTIFPAQPPRRVSDPASFEDFVAPDPTTYMSTEKYPPDLAQFSHQTDLAGQSIAVIQLCPVQYAPRAKALTLSTSMTIVLDGVGGYQCGDYLPPTISQKARVVYERMLRAAVANPQDVALRTSPNPRPTTTGLDPGRYDYVIITQSSWVDNFQPLADWKTKKGVPATIVTTDWIYNLAGYPGDNQSKIRAFVQDARDTWGATFFLLGGDTDVVPHHLRTILDDDIANDTYYADYDDDWICEAHLGRASVTSDYVIGTFVNKVLTYERQPPLTDYAATTGFFGFDLYTFGSHEGEGCKRYIEDYLIPADWTYRSEYDSEPGDHKADVIDYINQGSHLLNHIDHCGTYVMGVGYTNHGQMLGTIDMDNLNNGDRQGILYSIGCWPCAYDYSNCIAEHYVRDWNGGGVAFVGNARTGWYSPYSDELYSLHYDRYFFRVLFPWGNYTLGACFSAHKSAAYMNDDYYRYIYTELTLLGDPELPIWTRDPQVLTVTHDATLLAGEYTTFPVQVYNQGNPVSEATVCLWKEGDVYEIDTTNAAGLATFSFVPETTGTMYVTATCHNYLPYEGQAEVTEAGCGGDLDGDGDTDQADLGILLADWGCDDPVNGCPGDLTGDDRTDHADLGLLLADWGCLP